MYAVNLGDWLANKDDGGLHLLLVPVTQDNKTVTCEKGKLDGVAFVLNCDDERAEAILHIARRRYKKHELRFYHSEAGKSWRRK